MSKYEVTLSAHASLTVIVQADSEDEAIDLAFEQADNNFFPAGMQADLGDWEAEDGAVELTDGAE